MPVHPTAIVDRTAELDPTAEVCAYAVVEAGVRIGAGTRLWHHAFVAQGTTIGQRCQIHPFAVVGHQPQDFAWKGAPSYTRIGDETVIREGAQVHRGTMPESTTIVGARCLLMATSHVGHNCVLGDDVKLVNNVMLSGHVHVGDKAFISGGAGAHQFCRIGELAMVGGNSSLQGDVPPFLMFARERGLIGVNVVGLRRAGVDAASRAEIRAIYKAVFRTAAPIAAAIERAVPLATTEPARRLMEFLRAPRKRPLTRYRSAAHGEEAEA